MMDGILWINVDNKWWRVRMTTLASARLANKTLSKTRTFATKPFSRLDRIMRCRPDAEDAVQRR